MGSFILLNDTLEITEEQGSPSAILNLKKHERIPIQKKMLRTKFLNFAISQAQGSFILHRIDVSLSRTSMANGCTGVKLS